MRIGTVQEIWRYPVKSMAGHRLGKAEVAVTGIVGDRGWGLRNDETGQVQGGKKFPPLMRCQARYREEPGPAHIPDVEIRLPDGGVVSSDSHDLEQRLLSLTGGVKASLRRVRLPEAIHACERLARDSVEQPVSELARGFRRVPGQPFPDLAQIPPKILQRVSIPGLYFDLAAVHLLTTASLRFMQVRHPDAEWDVRRFRPNFLVRPERDGDAILIERGWVGRTLRIGASLTLHCVVDTPRCGMVTHAQENLAFDPGVLRSVVRDADQNLGVYAVVASTGAVREGDAVELLPP